MIRNLESFGWCSSAMYFNYTYPPPDYMRDTNNSCCRAYYMSQSHIYRSADYPTSLNWNNRIRCDNIHNVPQCYSAYTSPPPTFHPSPLWEGLVPFPSRHAITSIIRHLALQSLFQYLRQFLPSLFRSVQNACTGPCAQIVFLVR